MLVKQEIEKATADAKLETQGEWDIMKFIKGLAGIITATALLVNTTIVDAATWAYSNLNASETVVAYSADYPAQTAAAAAYWNSLAGTTVVAVTNNQADATVTIEKKDTPAGDADPNVALTYAPNGITDIYPSRIASQGVDLQTVITHELGHSLGLDHDAGSTLMAPAGGQLGGQAHDYQALKADLASHGRQLDKQQPFLSKSNLIRTHQPVRMLERQVKLLVQLRWLVMQRPSRHPQPQRLLNHCQSKQKQLAKAAACNKKWRSLFTKFQMP